VQQIVIIDDNERVCSLLETVLEAPEREIHTAVNAEEGLLLLKKFQPVLVLLDIQMPGMDGDTLFKIIKDDDSLKDTAIIAVTGMSESLITEKLVGLGFDQVITKPFTPKQVRTTVNLLIGG
jgi:CheY-like chemotaxis protein